MAQDGACVDELFQVFWGKIAPDGFTGSAPAADLNHTHNSIIHKLWVRS